MAGASTVLIAQRSTTASKPLSWQRLVLLVALLNAPLFFHGCGPNQSVRFTAGVALPFVEIVSPNKPVLQGVDLQWWSSWRCLLNFAATAAGVWLLCRASWIRRVADSRWTIAVLTSVALLFNSWWLFPELWVQAVYSPTSYVASLIKICVTGQEIPNEATAQAIVLISSRLYYLACLIVLGGVMFGLRAYLRRYFFVQTGHGWQVQLGGLMTVVLVLGTAIGLVTRLLMQQQ